MPAMLSCVVMAAAIWAVSQLPLGDVGLLLTCVLVGAIVYVVAMYRVAPRLMKDLRSKLGLFFRS
jgi:membrane protein implicated in regulation of membrane protease activity